MALQCATRTYISQHHFSQSHSEEKSLVGMRVTMGDFVACEPHLPSPPPHRLKPPFLGPIFLE